MTKENQNPMLQTSPSLQKSPFFIMGIVHRHFRNDANRLLMDKYNISTEMLKALEVIHHHDLITQQMLADVTMNERSATKRLVDNLIKRNLIISMKDEGNMKHKLLTLTSLGKETKFSGSEIVRALEKKWLGDLSEKDINHLKETCYEIASKNI